MLFEVGRTITIDLARDADTPRPARAGAATYLTEYLVNAPPACTSEFGPSAA